MEPLLTRYKGRENIMSRRYWRFGLTLMLGVFMCIICFRFAEIRYAPHISPFSTVQHKSVAKSTLKHAPLAESTPKSELLDNSKLQFDQSTLRTKWSPYMDFIDEETALQTPPVTDVNKSVDVGQSKVYLLEPRESYIVGDTIRVRIDLYDGYGVPRQTGGDQLRVRIFETALNASASGYILDHMNGSYTAIVKCLWAGKPTILVYISYTREAVRAIYYVRRTIPATRITFVRYTNMELRECHAFMTRLNQSSPLCDMTSFNGNMSWFCLAPLHGSSCKDFQHFELQWPYPKWPITNAEKTLFMRNGEHLTPSINISVKESPILQYKKQSKPPCFSFDRTQLWFLPSPVGHFMHNKWETEHCKMTPSTKFLPCLRNKYIVLYGDSTTRQWFLVLYRRYNCTMITEEWTKEKWKQNSAAYCPTLNVTFEWIPHAFPGNIDEKRLHIQSIAGHMLKFINNTDAVFLIHLFCHLSSFHHNVFKDRISHIRKSVDTVLKYNKNAKILIKGGHTFKEFGLASDYHGYVYRTITIEEFEGLYDKVVYLDNKDMTIAKEVKSNHPNFGIVEEMVDQMLSYICV